jgi:aryl carrier-like protein
MARLASIGSVNFFFQPFQVHLEPSDLLIQFGLDSLLLLQLMGRCCAENRRTLIEQLPFPLANLAWMQAVFAGKLIHCLVVLDGFYRYLKFELGRMPLTLN